MWIRSQNKERLINVNDIYIDIINTIPVKYSIYCNDCVDSIGAYSTKEKALKVLDKIEHRIEYYETFKNDINFYNKVFQMPQDDEV